MGDDPDLDHPRRRPGFLATLQSVLAAAFGVQSGKKRAEDFASAGPLPYIVGGILFTVAFVLTLVLVVRWVLP